MGLRSFSLLTRITCTDRQLSNNNGYEEYPRSNDERLDLELHFCLNYGKRPVRIPVESEVLWLHNKQPSAEPQHDPWPRLACAASRPRPGVPLSPGSRFPSAFVAPSRLVPSTLFLVPLVLVAVAAPQ